VDRWKVAQILMPYCPPLDQGQVEMIASEIFRVSQKELEEAKNSRKKSKSRS
jgi:hypothetical protein